MAERAEAEAPQAPHPFDALPPMERAQAEATIANIWMDFPEFFVPDCVHCGREAECFDADDLPSCKRCARQIPSCGDQIRRE